VIPTRHRQILHALRRLRVPLFVLAALATTACTSAPLSSRDEPSETPLFDGDTLPNWTPRGGTATYRVEDNTIVGQTRPNTPNTFLCTTRDYDDFVLEYEVLIDPALNSGVQIRSHAGPDGVVRGYQVEIDPTPRGYSGGIYEEGLRGWIAPPDPDTAANTPFINGQWNRFRVEARGPRLRTWINDTPVADFTDDAAAAASSGFIALQVHSVGDRAEPLQVRWRNLRIREVD
jgi:hypothetical protein